MHDGTPAPSIFQVDGARDVASSSSRCRRATRCPAGASASASATGQLVGALANIKGYLDYGSFAPVQLAASTALSSVRR
jgi:alanine-synthesizing transaminase